MPEAVKEVAPEKSPEKIIAKEVKPAEASSGSLPSSEEPPKNVEEGAVAPEIATDKPEEGKNGPEPSAEPVENKEGNGVVEKAVSESNEENNSKPDDTKKPETNEGKSSEPEGSNEAGNVDEKKEEKASEKSVEGTAETPSEDKTTEPQKSSEDQVKNDSSNKDLPVDNKKEDVGDSSEQQPTPAEEIKADIPAACEDSSSVSEKENTPSVQEEKEKVENIQGTEENSVDAKPTEEKTEPVSDEANIPSETSNKETVDTKEDESSDMQVDPAEANGSEKPADSSDAPAETAADVASNGKLNDEGAGRSAEADPQQVEEVKKLIREAKEQMAISEFFNAADLFGKACEVAGKLYGDLAAENAELYYLYGCAMLECAKNENAVLGEAVKEKEEEDEDDSEGAEENGEKEDEEKAEEKENEEKSGKEEADKANGEINGDEKMEVEEGNKEVVNGNDVAEEKEAAENGTESEATAEEGKENDEEEDSSLKTAWEMFELAKVIFTKMENDMKLSETYIKLGEVGMESGHEDSIEDMKKALELRLKCAAENDRLLAETHFNIGLAYATFQKFDDAIGSFKQSKSMIEGKIDKLKLSEQNAETESEIKELTELLPDLDEKIQDMKDSREAKLKAEQDTTNGAGGSDASAGSSKPASNITHLVKRKRKLEDVTSDLLPNTKQACTEEEAKPKEEAK